MKPSAFLACPSEGGKPTGKFEQGMKTSTLTIAVVILFLDKPYRLPVVVKTQRKIDCLGWIFRLMRSTSIAFLSRFWLRRNSNISSKFAD